MIHVPRIYGTAAATVAIASLAAAPASADIFATFDQGTFGGPLIRTVNVTTGADQSLPPGVNDPALFETHPTLSPNRRYLAFLARDGAQNRRVLMVDRTTGQFADLFTAAEAAADPPNNPTFSQDGTKVITGRRLERRDASSPPGALQASFTQTDITNFPNGPFPHQIVTAGGLDSTSPGRSVQPTPFVPTGFAFGIEYDGDPILGSGGGPPGRVTIQQQSGTTTLVDPAARLAHPTISQAAGVVVYEKAISSSNTKLVSRPLAGIATAPTTPLPTVVNRNFVQTHPTFSRNGRYLAFMRCCAPAGNMRLFVWDRLTQLLLNPDGIRVGFGADRREGGIALETPLVIVNAGVTPGVVSFRLAQASQVGIIVQRIVGRTRVLGRRAPKLRLVGRVPLGAFKKGRRHRVRWNRRVGGRRLRRGRYLVTVRSVTRNRRVRDLAKPVRVRIR